MYGRDPTQITLFQSTLSVRRATISLHLLFITILFQSTLSVRRATESHQLLPPPGILFQSTLSVRRATGSSRRFRRSASCISIHALREESDTPSISLSVQVRTFQSTLSVRRATGFKIFNRYIKIYFNPRSP